jgi:hypothetical protein
MTVVTDDWQEMVSGPGDFSVIRPRRVDRHDEPPMVIDLQGVTD